METRAIPMEYAALKSVLIAFLEALFFGLDKWIFGT
jgi:hypothetical protein